MGKSRKHGHPKKLDISNELRSLKHILKTIYQIISVVSTLSIMFGIILFFYGRITLFNKTDDDLIIERIKGNLGDYNIRQILKCDLHGLGNESIIVVAETSNYVDYPEDTYPEGISIQPRSKLLFYDQIRNSFLQSVYNLFGYGSQYSLRYSFAVLDSYTTVNTAYQAKVVDVIDLTYDGRPEIIVQFSFYPGSAGIILHGIFSYSIQTQSYYLIGTLPGFSEDDLGKIIKSDLYSDKNSTYSNYFDMSLQFDLGYTSLRDVDFFIETSNSVYLVRTTHTIENDERNGDPHTHYIHLYLVHNYSPDEIYWEYCYTEEIPGKREFCTKDFLEDYIERHNLLSYCYSSNERWY